MQFQKATKKRSKARIALDGPSGAGKTYTALIAATVMAEGGKIAVIDTERGSASLYADKFEFDVLELDNFDPRQYIEAIEAAEKTGYSVIVIDSLSHAWEGEGGALDQVDKAAKRLQGNSFAAWKDVTPLQRRLVDAMLQSPCHIIATMRSKMDYVQEKDEKTGKTIIRKVGMAPVQRQGMEYEFTIVGDMDVDHNLMITKSRCDIMADAVENKPAAKFWQKLLDWLNSGEEPAKVEYPEPAQTGQTLDGKDSRYDAEFDGDIDDPGFNIARTVMEIIDDLRLASKKLYKEYKDEEPSKEQYTLFISLLSQVAAGSDERRLTFLWDIFPKGKREDYSSKLLSRRQVSAILNWIDPQEYMEGNKTKYRVGNPNAINEFNLVVNAAIHRGMDELPGMDSEPEERPMPEAIPF